RAQHLLRGATPFADLIVRDEADYTRVRPRARPTTADTRNSTIAMKKMILAISMEAPATPPKPRMPAINAITRKVTTQPNMTRPLSLDCGSKRREPAPLPGQSRPGTLVPGRCTAKNSRIGGTIGPPAAPN